MYLQITTRCNFSCAHCCMAATPVGKDMSLEAATAAMKLAFDLGEVIVLGGGEPTLHAQFEVLLGLAILYSDEVPPFVVTNGSQTDRALLLARLTRRGVLMAELSRSVWHQEQAIEVDQQVIAAFTPPKDRYERAASFGIRTTTTVVAQGRGKRIHGAVAGCACPELFVDPEGGLWSCACQAHSYGTVFEVNYDDLHRENRIDEDSSCQGEWAS